MKKDEFLSMEDLADVFAQLPESPVAEVVLTPEELASQRRYEEIIKKHKANNANQ